MGCLNANIGVIYQPLDVGISLLDKVTISVIKINPNLVISIMQKMPFGLKAKLSVVCTTNNDVYIRLSPNVLWFFDEKDILDVNVISNIEWIVK